MSNFLGKNGFIWWMGVVEDREDPLNLGRCRVRIFGWHTDNLSLLPTSKLPWALPCNPPNATMTTATPIIGDYVFGFFNDGMSGNFPVMLGVLPGIPQENNEEITAFPSGSHYPKGEPTTSRLYRNEKLSQTAIGIHNSILDTGVETASGGSWSEPASKYDAKPPYNRVTETESGHIFEMDDTPGAERVHLAHKANTFFEIAPDGSKVTKVSGKNYEIYLSDNNVHIKGVCNITVDGDVNILSGGTITAKSTDINLIGDVNVTGKVTASGDVIGAGISLSKHKHSGVQSGGAKTGLPE